LSPRSYPYAKMIARRLHAYEDNDYDTGEHMGYAVVGTYFEPEGETAEGVRESVALSRAPVEAHEGKTRVRIAGSWRSL
jgi:hypothetical protein